MVLALVPPLYHCHWAPVMPPSWSLKLAVTALPSCGVRCDRLTLPCSSTFVTVMFTSCDSLATPSKTVTVTRYTLSPSAESMSSKLGPFLSSEDHRSAALLSTRGRDVLSPSAVSVFSVLAATLRISKRLASGPLIDQVIPPSAASSGSYASNTGRPEAKTLVPPGSLVRSNGSCSGVVTTNSSPVLVMVTSVPNAASARAIVPASFTAATWIVTVTMPCEPDGSSAVTVTVYSRALPSAPAVVPVVAYASMSSNARLAPLFTEICPLNLSIVNRSPDSAEVSPSVGLAVNVAVAPARV